MRRGTTVLAFVAAVLLLGALLSPLVYHATQAAAARFPALQPLADNPFPRFVTRTMMFVAVVGIVPLLRFTGTRMIDVGLTPPAWSQAGRGVVLGLVTIGIFVAMALLCDGRWWRGHTSPNWLPKSLLLSAGAAVIVAPLEELMFRGMLFRLLRGPTRWWPALVVSSMIFAIVHFLHTPANRAEVHWDSGLISLRNMFTPDGPPLMALAQMVNLTACGAILAWAFQRTGNLWFSMGLHAGWIFWLKMTNSLTVATADGVGIWGSRKVIDGWGALLALVLAAAFIPRFAKIPTPINENVPAKIVANVG